jgi:hypothetical protein
LPDGEFTLNAIGGNRKKEEEMTLGKIAILFALAGAQTVWAQKWTISTLVDDTTACPGSSGGLFNIATLFPAINGPWVVFLDSGDDNCTADNGPSIWSYNLISKALVKLVDTSTPIPEGTGDFEGFNELGQNLQINDGTVVFHGNGSGYDPATGCADGLYTVAVDGGAIHRVVDYTLTLPGYGGNYCHLSASYGINGLLGASINRGKVYFSAEAVGGPYANSGVWWAPANVNTTESELHLIADMSTVYTTPFNYIIDSWTGGFIGAAGLAFTGGGMIGGAGLFVNSPSNPILLSSYVLPGDAAHDTTYPDDASFYIGPVVDGDGIFFIGTDPFYQGTCGNGGGTGSGTFTGVFRTGLTGGTATSIMNTCNTQPNGDPLNGANSFNQLAANEGIAVFTVGDNTTGNTVLDSSVNGVVSQLIAPGEPLPTGASCSGAYHATGCATVISPVGTGGINGGRVVFNAEGGPYWFDEGIYVASLPCAASVTSDVSIDLGSLTYDSTTKLWSQTATVTNSGAKALSGPLSLVLEDLTSGVTLADPNGTTVCFTPERSSYINLYLSSNNRLPVGASTKATLSFYDPSDAAIVFTSEVVGPGAR